MDPSISNRTPLFTTPVLAVLAAFLGCAVVGFSTWNLVETAPDWLVRFFQWLWQAWPSLGGIVIGTTFAQLGIRDLKRRMARRRLNNIRVSGEN